MALGFWMMKYLRVTSNSCSLSPTTGLPMITVSTTAPTVTPRSPTHLSHRTLTQMNTTQKETVRPITTSTHIMKTLKTRGRSLPPRRSQWKPPEKPRRFLRNRPSLHQKPLQCLTLPARRRTQELGTMTTSPPTTTTLPPLMKTLATARVWRTLTSPPTPTQGPRSPPAPALPPTAPIQLRLLGKGRMTWAVSSPRKPSRI